MEIIIDNTINTYGQKCWYTVIEEIVPTSDLCFSIGKKKKNMSDEKFRSTNGLYYIEFPTI